MQRQRAENGALTLLAELREASPVLGELLLPDEMWDDFEASCIRSDSSLHCSMLVNAVERGFIERITGPLERYLMDGGKVRDRVTKQYRKDLRETWVLADEPISRHRQAAIFRGRLTELQVAEWLESQGATITGLEAWGAKSDLEFTDAQGHSCRMEVKYIGEEEAVLEAMIDHREGRHPDSFRAMYDACDYMLIRAFEAAVQLEGKPNRRVVCIALSHRATYLYDTPIEHNWMKWGNPKLSRKGQTKKMREFMARIDEEYPRIDAELGPRFAALDEIWILGMDERFAYAFLHRERPAAHN